MNQWTPVAKAQTTPAVDRAPEDRRFDGFSGWDMILVVNLFVVGLLLLGTALEGPADPDGPTGLPSDPDLVRIFAWTDVLVSLLLMAGLPVLWLVSTRVQPWEGTLRFLRIKTDSKHGWPFWLGIGALAAVGFYGLVVAFDFLLQAIGTDPGGDPLFEEIVRAGGWPIVIGLSISAGVGEEIMFRGILQKRLTWIGQAAIFGIAHVNQGFLAVGFIFLIALIFGYMVHKGVPLWAVMVTHILYDIILLGQLYVSL